MTVTCASRDCHMRKSSRANVQPHPGHETPQAKWQRPGPNSCCRYDRRLSGWREHGRFRMTEVAGMQRGKDWEVKWIIVLGILPSCYVAIIPSQHFVCEMPSSLSC